ncbi:MAG: hypothetical protein ABI625_01580 [bacterium]
MPTLPNATAALRASPRRFARFIGDPLNAAEDSSGDIVSSSRASVRASRPTSASRSANGESLGNACANLTFHGHTSWQICRLTHFEIPLVTGTRTLARTKR